MQARESLDVQFVEHDFRRRPRIGVRGERDERFCHARLQGEGRVVAVVEARRPVGMPAAVAEVLVAPFEAADDLAGVRVEQQLVRVEAMPGLRRVRTMRAQAVDEAGARAREVPMPDAVRMARKPVPANLALAVVIENAQFDKAGVLACHGEVHAVGLQRGPERIRLAGRQ